MGKAKTSHKLKESSESPQKTLKIKQGVGIRRHYPARTLLNRPIIGKAIWQCLLDNDPDGVMEILSDHLEASNKSKIAKKARLGRATLYHALKTKNPTLQTLAKIVHSFS